MCCIHFKMLLLIRIHLFFEHSTDRYTFFYIFTRSSTAQVSFESAFHHPMRVGDNCTYVYIYMYKHLVVILVLGQLTQNIYLPYIYILNAMFRILWVWSIALLQTLKRCLKICVVLVVVHQSSGMWIEYTSTSKQKPAHMHFT